VFQIVKNPKFDFMGKRKIFLALSVVLVLASVGLLTTKGLNKGIEFEGGGEVQVKFQDMPDIGQIRSVLAGLSTTTPVVTTIGSPDNHEVVIKIATPEATPDQNQGDLTQRVVDRLRFGGTPTEAEKTNRPKDLNTVDAQVLARHLADKSAALDPVAAEELAGEILALRKEKAIFTSYDELDGIEGLTPEVRSALEANTEIGEFALRSQSYIGPVIGKELKKNSMLAIIGSLIGMMLYIWIRFELQWGFAAVVALTHDTLITLGLFSLFGQEMSLPVVAAFLTLVGYSVNDTVVLFDRIRENVKTAGIRDFKQLVNKSINQTLSRTIITSGSTWIVVLGLLLFGGKALGPFAFVLVVGVLIGTYSSIFVASPIVVLWRELADRRAGAAATPAKTGKKVSRQAS
jgi:preprotein translocase subunit SecF